MEWCIEISAAAYINIPGKKPYNFRFYINNGRHHRGGLWIFGGQKELLRKMYIVKTSSTQTFMRCGSLFDLSCHY